MTSPTGNLVWQELVQAEDGAPRRDSTTSLRDPPQDGQQAQASTSSSPTSSRKPANRSQKAVAAVTGAVTTSLLMTPFDVIKTRLQTQSSAQPMFRPSSHISSSPLRPSSEASTSRQKLPPAAKAHNTTCCQQTFFTGNSNESSLTCKYDPDLDKQTKMSATAKPNGSNSANLHSRSAPTSFRLRPSPLSGAAGYSHSSVYSGSAALAPSYGLQSSTCAFPDRSVAASELEAISSSGRMNGILDGVVKISRAEGPRALWRGLSPTLLMTVPSQVTYMTCYDYFRAVFLSLEDKAPALTPPHITGQPNVASASNITPHTLFASLASGALSRSVSASLVTPLELIRTRLQASDSSQSMRSISASLYRQVATDGPKCLFRGLSSTLWRDVPFSAIYFTGYETVKRIMTGGNGLGEGQSQGGLEEFGVAFVSGASSGSVAAVFTHPFDLIKTRMQVNSGSPKSASKATSGSATLSALRSIVAEEGYVGLFRGLTPRVAKVAPACGLMIGSYEAVGTLFSMAGEAKEKAQGDSASSDSPSLLRMSSNPRG